MCNGHHILFHLCLISIISLSNAMSHYSSHISITRSIKYLLYATSLDLLCKVFVSNYRNLSSLKKHDTKEIEYYLILSAE